MFLLFLSLRSPNAAPIIVKNKPQIENKIQSLSHRHFGPVVGHSAGRRITDGIPGGPPGREANLKALVQRVQRASVTVSGEITGRIGRGFCVLLGVKAGDKDDDARALAHRTVNLRVFPDAQGKMNLSLLDVTGQILVVSQFTLYADTKKGNRPSFIQAAPPEEAKRLYGVYVEALRRTLGADQVATGIFRASMTVEILNEGPVTIELCTDGAKGAIEP
jgi:D-aminoacyl-tRNA deacylase